MRVTTVIGQLARKLRTYVLKGFMLSPAVTVLAGGMAFSGPAHAEELIRNGSFEVCHAGFVGICLPGDHGWAVVEGTATSPTFEVYSHSTQPYYAGPPPAEAGQFYLHTVGFGTLNTTPAVVEQIVDVSTAAGDPFVFSAYIAGFSVPINSPGDTAQLELLFFDGPGATGNMLGGDVLLDGTTGGADGLTDTWDRFAQAGQIPGTAQSARVRILQATAGTSFPNDNGNDNYVDLVSLQIVPEPLSIALIGIGTAGLMVAFRLKQES